MTPREQKESVRGFKNKKEEVKEKKRRKRNYFTKHVFTNDFPDSILSAVCKK